jgi:hypothetical protein
MDATLTALVSIIAGLAGAFVGHVLSEKKSRNDELAKMRLDAYGDFLRAVSNLVAARRAGRTLDSTVDLGELNDAKARMCVCADASVVAALERFWLQGGTLEKEQEIIAFTRLCSEMRASLGRDRIPFETNLSEVLFRLEPSTYSYRAEVQSKSISPPDVLQPNIVPVSERVQPI